MFFLFIFFGIHGGLWLTQPSKKKHTDSSLEELFVSARFCDITLYADNYMSTMHCDPFLSQKISETSEVSKWKRN